MASRKRNPWHSLVRDVLATLTRESGGPTVEEQLGFGTWLSTLPERERFQAMNQLGLIVKRFTEAGEMELARVIRSIAVFASQSEAMPHAAARVRLMARGD